MNNNQLEVVRESEELIPEPTARLVEKSIAENTMRNRKQALRAFSYWLRGRGQRNGCEIYYCCF